eukprot:CAMPEP_0113629656 /NCGR_PEP_ID=MMETSP0017_2-20120614/15398_1 /TAXON_ID=2856 /ORGANISM="Cylindrotheca closterium" /LENGTH=404 /DNA_ID=CAMNT_0000540069 /DNA_START=96 /DNA_END=1310 /DNA_ORIENTATION=- /assembly_acc=CAM_ASM_000147
MKSSAVTSLLLLLASSNEHASAFAPRSMNFKRNVVAAKKSKSSSTLFLWVNDFSKNGPPTSLEARVQDTLQSLQLNNGSPASSTESIQLLVHELELVQNDCTEEGNQTADECDIALKEKRDKWIKDLEEYINMTAVQQAKETTTTASAGVAPLASSASTNTILPSSDLPIEAQVQSCLETASVQATVTTTTSQPLTLFHVANMHHSLEELQNECSEEGNQTKDECDVVRMEERNALLLELDNMLSSPSLELIQATLNQLDSDAKIAPQDWLQHFDQWLSVLEEQNFMCSEEGHQTENECDVQTMEWRSQLTLRLEDRVSQFQKQTVKATQDCLQYQLCNTAALERTYANLEEVELMCTEEGNQTRSFCNLDAKEERQALMEQISHQLDLAQAVVQLKKDISFQI